ncbi:MAG: hypothetical protein H7318_00715 [Oligoflexus sp.]|nr:hypothetical protein [Oligoflexus sp.]
MKLMLLLLILTSLGCKPIDGASSPSSVTSASLSATIKDYKIDFTGSPAAKIAYCDSPSDTVEPLVKESAEAEWKSPSLAEREKVYILDGELEIFEPNEPCSGAELYSLIRAPMFVADRVSIPDGQEAIGDEKLMQLKRIDPETKLTATSLLPRFKTAPARFAKLDIAILNPDGTAGERFVKEFELKQTN